MVGYSPLPQTTHPMTSFQPNMSIDSTTSLRSDSSPNVLWSYKSSPELTTTTATTPKTSVYLSSFTPSLYHQQSQLSPSQTTGEVSFSPTRPEPPSLTAQHEQLLENSQDQLLFTNERTEDHLNLTSQNTMQHSIGGNEVSGPGSVPSPKISKHSSNVVWSHVASSVVATTPVSIASLTPSLYQQQDHSPLNQAYTTPSRLTQSQPLVEFTPDLTTYSPVADTHTLVSPVDQLSMVSVGSIESSDQLLQLSKRGTPTTSPLQNPSMFKTPESTGLLSAIEPPTPFQHADFDLDSSFSDLELHEDKEDDLLLSVSSNSSPEPSDTRAHTSTNLFKGQSPVVRLQTQVAVGQLLDLEEFN